MAVLEEIGSDRDLNDDSRAMEQRTTQELKREVARLERLLKEGSGDDRDDDDDDDDDDRRRRREDLEGVKKSGMMRFQRARALAMDAKFRPERLRTDYEESDFEKAGEGVVFGVSNDEDATNDGLSERVEAEDLISLPPQWQFNEEKAKYIAENEVKYTNGDVYKGETVDQIRHGRGIHVCSNGDTYEGGWKEDRRHGFGTMTFTNEMTYVGDWVEDKTFGFGTCKYANGDVYEGEWKNDHRWGWGKQTWKDTGDVYEGEWFDDIPEGEGAMIHDDGNANFQGSFLNGQRKHGVYTTKDGSVEYTGSFAEGNLRHGKGVFFANGSYKYDGDWKFDQRDGKGKCIYDKGIGEYEGDWKTDMRHGKGVMLITNEYEYEGRWKDDREDGKGTAKYLQTNETYVGLFKDGLPCGYGKRLFSDGSIYEGEFANGLRSGRGAFTNKEDGSKYRGEWLNDKKNGYGACQFGDGTVFRGEWKDDCWVQSTACPKKTKVFGNGIVSAIAGSKGTFGIEARDELNNKRLSGGDAFHVLLTLHQDKINAGNERKEEEEEEKVVEYGEITDNCDGTYSISYACTVAGMYTCKITIGDDEHVANSPYANLVVHPASADAKKCKVRGEGVKNSKCFEEASFIVECRDSNENLCASPLENQVRILVRITDASGNEIKLNAPMRIEDTGRGSYLVRYVPEIAGFYVVNIFEKKNGANNYRSTLLGKSPYSMRVRDVAQLDAPPPKSIDTSENAQNGDSTEELINEEEMKFGKGNIAPPPRDLARDWLDIARSDYISVDKNDFGFDSSSEDEEDPDVKFARENPNTPVITNLEDVYKVPRLNRMLAEKRAREQAQKVQAMKVRLETKEKAKILKQIGGGADYNDKDKLGGLD